MFGASPQDDEELAGAAPGVAGAIPPPPVVGMPDMSGLAAPAAPGAAIPGQPPAPDMGAPTPGVNPGVPPAPNANLGPDDPMQPAPAIGAPTPPPGAPIPPPLALTPDGKIDVNAEQKKTLSAQDQNAADAETAERKIGDVNATNAAGMADAAKSEAAIALQKQKDDEAAIATANQQTQGWITKAQQDAAKYQGMGLHDYWDHQSTGNKVLAGISVMFGAAGRADGNPGLAQVNKAIDRDFEMQQQNIAKAKSNVETDNQMISMGLTAKQQALADNNLKKAGALDATAAQLQSYLMKQGVPLAQAQTDKNVAALREKANQTRMETLEKVHAQNVQDSRLAIEQQNADTARLRAEKYKTRTGKGGGGAGGSARAQMAEAYAAWLEKNPNATEPEKTHQANVLGLPLTGRPSDTTKKSVEEAFNVGGKAGIPQVLTDTLTGKDLPVDRNRTDAKKHNAAVAGLPQVNGAIQILDTVLKGADKPHAPEALSYLGVDTSAQANLIGEMTRFRSAYAASKKESVGEANAHELAQAIPDPPSAASSRANWENWKKKIEETKAELHESRNGLLANAGVRREDFGGVNDRPGGEAAPRGAPAATGGVTPAQRARAKAVLADPVAKAKLNDKQLAIVTRAAM